MTKNPTSKIQNTQNAEIENDQRALLWADQVDGINEDVMKRNANAGVPSVAHSLLVFEIILV